MSDPQAAISRYREMEKSVFTAENAIGRRVYALTQPISREQYDAIIDEVYRKYLKRFGVEIDSVIVYDDYPFRIVLKEFNALKLKARRGRRRR